MKIHHIGYLVKKLPQAAQAFRALGFFGQEDAVRDEERKADILFLEKDGYRVELISPYSGDSIVAGLLKTYRNAPYHICYEADDFEADIRRLEQTGYVRMGDPQAAPAIGGRRVVFLMHAAMGMIELLEREKNV